MNALHGAPPPPSGVSSVGGRLRSTLSSGLSRIGAPQVCSRTCVHLWVLVSVGCPQRLRGHCSRFASQLCQGGSAPMQG